MKRPTVSCCVIAKNEENNVEKWFKSMAGCFDEIIFVDTGSTDKTVEIATSLGCKVHHFEWVNDFSTARNYAFSLATSDFIFWNDLDDVLFNKEAFIRWRDDAMGLCDYWLATYDYASDDKGNPVVSFARERVVRNNLGLKWKYFVHEGLPPVGNKPLAVNYITTWKVVHQRTVEDLQKDKFRNLKIFDVHKKDPTKFDARMRFYYGKELFEANRPMDAFHELMGAVTDESLDVHDRVLGIQYVCMCLIQCNQYDTAINIGLQGVQLMPNKAEFHTMIGDCYLKKNELLKALPFYMSAKSCRGQAMAGDVYAGPTFNHTDAYTTYPRNQIARIYFHLGEFDKAKAEVEECMKLYKNQEARELFKTIDSAMEIVTIPTKAQEVDEIVISTPPVGPYEWDEEKAKTKGMGGSETAAIEMAKHLHKLSGLPVKIYNQRQETLVAESGVQYIPVNKLNEYFSKYQPKIHIAWRHNTKLTNAPTYLWCHDLTAPGCEVVQNFDKMLCLSPFHKRYVMAMQGIPEDKIILTRNGIDPSRFKGHIVVKNPNKIIFPSSPDRGLDRAIKIVEMARSELPDLELHVFYGFDNLRKGGLSAMADELEKMISERPWIKYHGFTEQKELARHMMESVVWLYPANFIESFCITVLESLSSKCYPIAREIGALQDTLRDAYNSGMASLLDMNCETQEEYKVWTKELVDAVREERWKDVLVDPDKFSWESVAAEWIDLLGLNKKLEAAEHLDHVLEGSYG